MEFRVLGAIEVVEDGVSLRVGGPKPRALLAHLLVEAGRAVSRERLAEDLWGGDAPPTARDSLHVHLTGLRRVLGPRLQRAAHGYLLEAWPEEIDADRFEAAVAAAREDREDPAAVAAGLAQALTLWRGPVFGGIPVGPTAAAAAARLEELRCVVIEDRVDADLALGRHAALVTELTGLVAASPTRERLTGQLMLALHRCDRSAEALSVFGTLCRALDEQLGVDPGDAVTALSRAIHRHDPTLAMPDATSLPISASRFIGRGEELAQAGALLAGRRLLTLTGPGGSGKTRLAVELARAAAPAHPHGVHLVDLAPLTPTASVSREIATALGVRERLGTPLTALLAAWLQHRRCLIVLDNCEHVVVACAELCTLLLQAAPGLRILATSRESLGISGEAVFALSGLELPRADESAESISRSDAVRLFVDRAAAVRAGFEPGPADMLVIAALCRRLDGLPLAIELAAARMGGITLAELAPWLEERLDALGGSRAVHARHRTMRAAMEWSYDLLDDAERAVLRRLSVFAGGMSSQAAGAVVQGWEPVAAGADILELCGRLSAKSMLLAEPGTESTRYRMLEVVRQFAAEHLADAGETVAARHRHAAWYHALVPDARTWAGPDQPAWMDRLGSEVANVRTALGWYIGDGGEPSRALEMVGRLWWFWYMRGMLGEGRGWFRRVLAAAPTEATAARGLALRGAAATARIMGDFAEAIELGNQALETFRLLDDDRGVAASLNNLCISAMSCGEMEMARRYAEESLIFANRLDDTQGVANSSNSLGMVARNLGDLDAADRLFAVALAAYRSNHNDRGVAAVLSNLAIVGHQKGEAPQAHGLAIDALRLYSELDFDEGKLDCLGVLAALDAGGGRPAAALRTLGVITRRREELGAPLTFPDEIRLCAVAQAAAEGAVGHTEAARVHRDSLQVSVDDLVAEILGSAAGSDGAITQAS